MRRCLRSLGFAFLLTSLPLAAAAAPLKIVLNDAFVVAGPDAARVRAQLEKNDPRAALRDALTKAAFALAAEACEHHDLEVKLFVRAETSKAGKGTLREALLLLQVGVPIGSIHAGYSDRGKPPTADDVVAMIRGPLVSRLRGSPVVSGLQRPPEGAAAGRALACRRAAAAQPFVEPLPSNPEAKATADCAKKDGASCWEAGIIVRERGLKANDAKTACDAASALFRSGCELALGEACYALGQNLARCAKSDAEKKAAANAFQKAVDQGLPQACPEALGKAGGSAAAVRDACFEIAKREGRSDALELQVLACELGGTAACGAVGSSFASGSGAPQQADTARVFFSAACAGGDGSACEKMKAPPAPIIPARPAYRPSVTVRPPHTFNLPRHWREKLLRFTFERITPEAIPQRAVFATGNGGALAFDYLLIGRDTSYKVQGYAIEADVKLGMATNSGFILDSRAGFGVPLFLKRFLFMPVVGLGLGGFGLFNSDGSFNAPYSVYGYAGGRMRLYLPYVSLEAKGSAAWVYSRDAEYRVGGSLGIRRFRLGAEWTRFSNQASLLSFTLGFHL